MSDIWFVCKKTDKVVELSDCLECEEPKNCLSLASYQQGRADRDKELLKEVDYLLNCGMGKKKALVHLRGILVKEQTNE